MQGPPDDRFERVLSESEKAALRDGVFVNRELAGMDLTRADLRGTHFERTRLARCDLANADLRGAQFILCEIEGVILADAVLGDNRFDGTTLVDVHGLAPASRALIERAGGTFLPSRASLR